MKYTISVDFDGVIHSYTTPWINAHTIPDPPVEGAIAWLIQMVQCFNVVIFSTRCRTWRGRRAMRKWLRGHGELYWESLITGTHRYGLNSIRFSYTKPPALIYLDDRAVRFTGPGTFPTKDDIHQQYIPWNKSQHATRLSARGPVL